MPAWEYAWASFYGGKVNPVLPPLNIGPYTKNTTISEVLIRLGNEGWELVGTTSAGPAIIDLFFKRPKQTKDT